MLRLSLLFLVLTGLFSSCISETILADSLGNIVSLPWMGGAATHDITNFNNRVSTSPYRLQMYLNNENGEIESFFIVNSFGDARLVGATFQPYLNDMGDVGPAQSSPGNYLGSPAAHNVAEGVYTYTFVIPPTRILRANITYFDLGAPQPIVDRITIAIDNPAVVVGDPQFVGLRGQSFQIHGIDGAIYNIISDENTQVNSRFVFLTKGECPIIDGKPETNCWSHEGSYLGAMSFQQRVEGKLHRALVTAGSAKQGFALVELDGKKLSIGDSATFGSFCITMKSSHVVSVKTENFSFELSNSDMFINQAVKTLIPLSKLHSHGLLGQTHNAKIYKTPLKFIVGKVDDYLVESGDIYGNDFIYNQFQL